MLFPTYPSIIVLVKHADKLARDELKFVIGSREDYEWSKALIVEHGLLDKPYELLFSTVHGKITPKDLAEGVIADRLPVRFQLQMHKYIWDPNERGV